MRNCVRVLWTRKTCKRHQESFSLVFTPQRRHWLGSGVSQDEQGCYICDISDTFWVMAWLLQMITQGPWLASYSNLHKQAHSPGRASSSLCSLGLPTAILLHQKLASEPFCSPSLLHHKWELAFKPPFLLPVLRRGNASVTSQNIGNYIPLGWSPYLKCNTVRGA